MRSHKILQLTLGFIGIENTVWAAEQWLATPYSHFDLVFQNIDGFVAPLGMLVFLFVMRTIERRDAVNEFNGHSPRSFVLDLMLRPEVARDVQLNLSEVMPVWVEAHGLKRAKLIRAWQIVRIVVGENLSPLLAFGERVLSIVRGG